MVFDKAGESEDKEDATSLDQGLKFIILAIAFAVFELFDDLGLSCLAISSSSSSLLVVLV